jgi:hypothetical protein
MLPSLFMVKSGESTQEFAPDYTGTVVLAKGA